MDRKAWTIAAVLASLLALLVQIVFIISYNQKAVVKEAQHAREIGELTGRLDQYERECGRRLTELWQLNETQNILIQNLRRDVAVIERSR